MGVFLHAITYVDAGLRKVGVSLEAFFDKESVIYRVKKVDVSSVTFYPCSSIQGSLHSSSYFGHILDIINILH